MSSFIRNDSYNNLLNILNASQKYVDNHQKLSTSSYKTKFLIKFVN